MAFGGTWGIRNCSGQQGQGEQEDGGKSEFHGNLLEGQVERIGLESGLNGCNRRSSTGYRADKPLTAGKGLDMRTW